MAARHAKAAASARCRASRDPGPWDSQSVGSPTDLSNSVNRQQKVLKSPTSAGAGQTGPREQSCSGWTGADAARRT